jgi:hypothetical protein
MKIQNKMKKTKPLSKTTLFYVCRGNARPFNQFLISFSAVIVCGTLRIFGNAAYLVKFVSKVSYTVNECLARFFFAAAYKRFRRDITHLNPSATV